MALPSTPLVDQLGIRVPIVQAPMSGLTPPELVASVSNAGGLGSFGGAWLSPEQLRAGIRAVRGLTTRPFNVNLFSWSDLAEPPPDDVTAVQHALAPYRRELDLPDDVLAPIPTSPRAFLLEQLAVVAEEAVPVFSFTFGIPPLNDVRESGAFIVGTATTVAEAVALEDAGVDAVVAQGAEAGGHRGTFLADVERSLVGTIALVPQVVDAVAVPVIAAGGVMDGRGVAAALMLGAQAAQLGTAFLACAECTATSAHKAALGTCPDSGTCITDVYSGRAARAVRTPIIEDLEARLARPLPYPLQHARTNPIHRAAAERGRADLMYLLMGQASRMARALPAAELVDIVVAEAEAALRLE